MPSPCAPKPSRMAAAFVSTGRRRLSQTRPIADLVIVFAMTDPSKGYYGGVTAFLVESGTPGFVVSQKFEKMGLRTSPIGELVFEDVYVPAEAVLGGVGAGLDPVYAGDGLGADLPVCRAISARWSASWSNPLRMPARVRSSVSPSVSFKLFAHRIVDMKVQLEAARLLTYRAAWRLGRVKHVSMDASMAKLFVSESLVKAALDTVQIHGGYGYMTEYELERALRDAVGSTIYSGTSEMQRNIIARWLGL